MSDRLGALVTFLFTVAALAGGGIAMAQDDGAQASRGAIDEVMVTSQKREESIQTVPVAVTAVTGERMDQLGAVTIEALRGYVPNVQIQQFSNTPHGAVFNIRGMGVIEPDPYAGTTVVVTQDGVPQFFNMTSLLDTYDLERIEVLRGPQGTLFGASSTGGVIQALTRRPDLDEFGGEIYASYGNYDRLDVRGAINIPLVDGKLAARLTFSHFERDGFNTNIFDGKSMGDKDRNAFRLSLLYDDGEDFDLALITEYSAHRDGTPHSVNGSVAGEALHVPEGTMVPGALLPMYRSPCLTVGERCKAPKKYFSAGNLDRNAKKNDGVTGTSVPDIGSLDSWSTTLIVNWDTSIGEITSITGYKDWRIREFTDQDWTPVFLDDTDRRTEGWQFSQELRDTIAVTESFDLMVGVFFAEYHWNHFQDFRIQFAAPGFRQLTTNLWETKTFSGFMHGYLDLSDRLRVQGGVRVNNEKTIADSTIPAFVNLTGLAELRGPGANLMVGPNEIAAGTVQNAGKESWTELAGKFVIEFDVNDDAMVYGMYAHGFKSGGFTGRIGIAADLGPYDPEFVDTIELGLKSDWFDNRLRFNLAAFYNWYDDIQLAQIFFITNEFGQTVNGNTILNAASAKTRGFEVEIIAVPLDWLTLNAALGYLDATFSNFITFNPGLGVDVDNSGNVLQNAPKWTINMGFDADFMLGNFVEMSINMQYKYVSKKFNTSLFNVPRAEIQGTHIVDLNVDFTPPDGEWTLGIWARNLFDNRYIDSVFDAPGVFGLVNYQDPRTYGVSVKANF